MDVVQFAADLIRCPSVTPKDAGAIDVLISVLEPLGFECHPLVFQSPGAPAIRNLYARHGQVGRNLCFAGHTDVVPAGDHWSVDPFRGAVQTDRLFGRGAVDMKGAIAAFVAGVCDILDQTESVSLLITGDEEGPALDGTVRVLDWLKSRGELIDACLVGEPTNPHRLGEMIKVGRRGSFNAVLTVHGIQGHVAYPHRADNPVPKLIECLNVLQAPLDQGTPRFQASNLEVTSLDVGNTTTNLIPGAAQARFNVRFNSEFTGASLEEEIRRRLDKTGHRYELDARISGESFVTEDEFLIETLSKAIEKHTQQVPERSTSGGTSDARFIKDACPVIEFGLVGETMHRVDEHVRIDELRTLTDIYRDFVIAYFSR